MTTKKPLQPRRVAVRTAEQVLNDLQHRPRPPMTEEQRRKRDETLRELSKDPMFGIFRVPPRPPNTDEEPTP